jgi:class 3 adenylate cyclase
MSFVSFTEFQVRYENTVPAADEERVAAYLDDACALVSDIVGATAAAAWDEDGSGTAAPGGVVAAVCAAVRRAYDNPGGLAGETIGDYSWRGASAPADAVGVYFTAAEIRQIKRAAGASAVGTIELQGMLPDSIGAAQYLTVSDGGAPVLYFDGDDVA